MLTPLRARRSQSSHVDGCRARGSTESSLGTRNSSSSWLVVAGKSAAVMAHFSQLATVRPPQNPPATPKARRVRMSVVHPFSRRAPPAPTAASLRAPRGLGTRGPPRRGPAPEACPWRPSCRRAAGEPGRPCRNLAPGRLVPSPGWPGFGPRLRHRIRPPRCAGFPV
eukprot:15795655-Heterocapsa_arctica.AAC.1